MCAVNISQKAVISCALGGPPSGGEALSSRLVPLVCSRVPESAVMGLNKSVYKENTECSFSIEAFMTEGHVLPKAEITKNTCSCQSASVQRADVVKVVFARGEKKLRLCCLPVIQWKVDFHVICKTQVAQRLTGGF